MNSERSTRRRRTLAFSTLFATISVGAVACNVLLSTGDYQVGGDAGPDATTPSDGSGPTPDGANDAHPAPDGGMPGDAGDSGGPKPDGAIQDAGKADSATCSPASLPLEAGAFQTLVHQCLLWAGCDPGGPVPDDCITFDDISSSPIVARGCLAIAKTCDDISACVGQNFLLGDAAAAACGATQSLIYTTASCDDAGNSIQCTNSYGGYFAGYSIHCAARGQGCGTYASDPQNPDASSGGCIVGGGCGQDDPYTDLCIGNTAVTACQGDASIGYNCSLGATGSTCQASGTVDVGCYDPTDGGSCTPPGTGNVTYTCTGPTTASFCLANGQRYSTNCGPGLSCVGTNGCQLPACSGTDVSACAMNEGCTGTGNPAEISLCIGGVLTKFDCGSMGPGWLCRQYDQIDMSNHQALCAPPGL